MKLRFLIAFVLSAWCAAPAMAQSDVSYHSSNDYTVRYIASERLCTLSHRSRESDPVTFSVMVSTISDFNYIRLTRNSWRRSGETAGVLLFTDRMAPQDLTARLLDGGRTYSIPLRTSDIVLNRFNLRQGEGVIVAQGTDILGELPATADYPRALQRLTACVGERRSAARGS